MRRRIAALILGLIFLPLGGLAEDFLVGGDTADTTSIAALAGTQTDNPEMQEAITLLDQGNLLDALNAFAKITGVEGSSQYADYTRAKLMLMRENPAEAIALWEGLSGFLDSDYQLASAKALRLHRFAEDGVFGYVDETGAWKIQPQFDWAERVFRSESATEHDATATEITPEMLYTVAMVFSGTTEVTDTDKQPLDGKYGLVRNDGVLVVPTLYEEVLWTNNGYAAVKNEQGCRLYSIATGKTVGGVFEDIGEYAQGFIPVKANGLWGYLIPETGKLLGQGYVWISALSFREGYAAVSTSDGYGFIDRQGETVIPLQYTGASSFSEGLAGVRVKKKWGFINTSGEWVIQPAYAEVKTFQGGVCAVKRGSAWGVIDTGETMLLPAKYSEIGDFDPIYHRAWIRNNKLWGLISSDGTVVAKPSWSTHDEFNGNTLCRVGYRGSYSFIDSGGKTRIPESFVAAAPFTADYAGVRLDDGTVTYLNKMMNGFALETSVPVECRQGFIEGRRITEASRQVTDEAGSVTIVTEKQITYLLYDMEGTAIEVSAYAGG